MNFIPNVANVLQWVGIGKPYEPYSPKKLPVSAKPLRSGYTDAHSQTHLDIGNATISRTTHHRMRKTKIVHVYYKDAGIHEYYSSVMAMYHEHTEELFGIKYASLSNALRTSNVYENKRIIVRIGIVRTSPQKRKKHEGIEQ